MAGDLLLNPLTYGKLVARADAPPLLEMRCYARRRSLDYIQIDPLLDPELHAALWDWLNGGAGHLPDLKAGMENDLWTRGLLITHREMERVPQGISPEAGPGHGIAAGLCPEAAGFLRDGPSLPSPPPQADAAFVQNGFCLVPPLLGQDDLVALRAYYRMIVRYEWLKLDSDDALRRSLHNDPLARMLQDRLTPYFAALTGQAIKPSFAYTSRYEKETPLKRHTDRAQCAYTFSLFIEYQPEEADGSCPWPLIVHAQGGDVELYQQAGGGAIFHGNALEHSRPPLPPGHTAQLMFLCYVPEDFVEDLD